MIPSIGRTVHYILPDNGKNPGEHRPAIIVRVWDAKPHEQSCVQLQVFTDGENDGLPNVTWKTSVQQDATGQRFGSWHEPEEAVAARTLVAAKKK